jgi:hypothetical protein
MQLSCPGFFQDIFPVEFLKYLAESQCPDHIFSNVEKITSGKLVDEYKNKKTQPIIIRVGFSAKKEIPFKTEADDQTCDPVNSKCFGYCIGNSNCIYIENCIIEVVPDLYTY